MEKSVLRIFESYPEIKLVYLFGSTAKGNRGPMSDYDFAVFLGSKDKKMIARTQFQLMDDLSRCLKTDRVDVIMLDLVDATELKYNIIHEGQLIFEREPFRVLFEPRVLNEYFDFHLMLKRHALTRA